MVAVPFRGADTEVVTRFEMFPSSASVQMASEA